MAKSVAAIICAAGPGKRFGGKRKKPFVDVAGRAIFMRSIELFANRDDVKQVLLGISEDEEEIGGGIPDACFKSFQPVLAPAPEVQPVGCEIRLNSQMEVGNSQYSPAATDQQRRPSSKKLKVHSGLKTSRAGW